MKNCGMWCLCLPLLFLLVGWSQSLSGGPEEGGGANDGRGILSAPAHRDWAVSPAVGFVFGGLLGDVPGSDDIAYGVKVSHRMRPGLRTVYSVSALGGSQDFIFLNARADYFFRRDALLEPFASAGAGLITGDTGTEFDFLFGAGLEVSLTDRFSVEEAAIVHLSPAQALTDREGNPFTVLESSINFWF